MNEETSVSQMYNLQLAASCSSEVRLSAKLEVWSSYWCQLPSMGPAPGKRSDMFRLRLRTACFPTMHQPLLMNVMYGLCNLTSYISYSWQFDTCKPAPKQSRQCSQSLKLNWNRISIHESNKIKCCMAHTLHLSPQC